MRTRSTTTAEAIANRKWWILDLEDVVLGRAATRIANVLRGKHKPTFTPNIDDGDFVIVINADKVKLTGTKWSDKIYYRHTNFPGGIKSATAREMNQRHPDEIIRLAVFGMIPKGPLGRAQISKLKIYAGAAHPHVAQNPQPFPL
ncbi:MAG: 50S ribosomal protein L13 [Deltaproteobacteria bacterium]|nr:50S ribosomal protein L13 [Deltaproteobacteria bacterium]